MNNRAFCFLSDNAGRDYIYNLVTGIKFEIDNYSKNIIDKYYENIQEYEDLYEILVKNSFININLEELSEKVPVISPYIIWNNKNVVCPDANGVYKILTIYEDEYTFLDNIDKMSSLREILSKLTNINFYKIRRLISYEMQCIKLVDKDELESAELYFNCPGPEKFIHEEDEITDNNIYYGHISEGYEKEQFENVETTISYMLREKTAILNNGSFGECFIKKISERYYTKQKLNILEVGGGLADMADAILDYLAKREISCTYTICDNSDTLSCYQQSRLDKKYINIEKEYIIADIEKIDIDKKYNVVISNEVIADLQSEKVSKNSSSFCKNLIDRYQIKDIKGKYLNTGAIRFIEKINKILDKGGIAVLTEYTDVNNESNISNMMPDHKEVSINFEILKNIAKQNGLKAEVMSMQNFLDIMDCLVMAGESFYALKKIYNIKKKFYTEEDITKINYADYRNIRYEALSNILNFFQVLVIEN